MSKETFTNRHGVTTLVDESKGEVQAVAPLPSPQPEKVAKKPSRKTQKTVEPVVVSPQPMKPFPWKMLRLLVLACIAIGVAIIFGAQVNSSQYQSAQDNMKNAVLKAKSEKFTTEKELASVVATLQKDLPSISCPTQTFPIQFTQEAKAAITKCRSAQNSYDGIRHNLDTLSRISSYGTSMSNAMKPALTNAADGTFVNIAESTANWQAATDKIASISPPTELREAHKSVVDATKNVMSAWQALKAADASHDSAAYDAAKIEVSNAYESFRGISGQYLTTTLPIQNKLLEQINTLN